ncbi:hypothetical protein CBR_g24234, partial [Chara braunii]
MATLAMGAIGLEAGMVLPGCATWQKRIRDGEESGAMASSTVGNTCASDRCQLRGSTAMVATCPSRISTSASISVCSRRLIPARLHTNFHSRRDMCHCLANSKERRKAAPVWRSTIAGQGASASTSTDPIGRPQVSDSAVLSEGEAGAPAAAVIVPEAPAEPAAATPSSTAAAAAAGDVKGTHSATLGSAEIVAVSESAETSQIAVAESAVSEASGRGTEPAQVSATGSETPSPAASDEAKPAAAAAAEAAKPVAAEGKPVAAEGKAPAAAVATAKAKPAVARRPVKPKEPAKEFSLAMVEDVIPPLQASLEKENITSLALSFQDNQ